MRLIGRKEHQTVAIFLLQLGDGVGAMNAVDHVQQSLSRRFNDIGGNTGAVVFSPL